MKSHLSLYKLFGEYMLLKISKMKFRISIGKYIGQMAYRPIIVEHRYKQKPLICGHKWKKEFKVKDHDFQDHGLLFVTLPKFINKSVDTLLNQNKTPSLVKEERTVCLQITWFWKIRMTNLKLMNFIRRQKINLPKFPSWQMVNI